MAWFRYLKKGEITSSESTSENYQYPLLRRKINIPTISHDISIGTWLFVKLNGFEINSFFDDSGQKIYDDNSYIVVYTGKGQDDYSFTPIKTLKIGDLLFFQTAENHNLQDGISKDYFVYYKTKSIKDIKAVQNGTLTDYVLTEPIEAEFETDLSDVEEYYTNITTSDVGKYSFSFMNPNLDWKDGVSQNFGAKVIGNFTGPNIQIKAAKGPDYGKFDIRIIALSSDATPIDELILDWQTIDTYNNEYLESEIVYENNSLDYREYIFEIISEFDKNILSTDGKVKINSYNFLQDIYATLAIEELSPFLLTRVVSITI